MTGDTKPQSAPNATHKIIFKVGARDMRAISQAAKRSKMSVSQYAKAALLQKIGKDVSNDA